MKTDHCSPDQNLASADSANECRGHESAAHRLMKQRIYKLYRLLGWFVFYEEGLADVVVWRRGADGRMRLLAIEVERSTRNLIRNLTRDLSRGASTVLVVVPVQRLQAAVRRKLRANGLSAKAGVTTIANIERLIAIHENRNPKQ